MHLKPYPALQKSELRLEPCPDGQRGGLHLRHQAAMRTEWGLRPAYAAPRAGSSSSSTTSSTVSSPSSCGGQSPLAVISSNTPSGGPASRPSGDFHAPRPRKTKTPSWSSSPSPSSARGSFTSSLLLLSSGWDGEASLGLLQAQYQAHRDREGGEGGGVLDIWAVIKPGNTKEKIAIFASPQRDGSDGEDGDDGESEPMADEEEEEEEGEEEEEESGSAPGTPAAQTVRVVSLKAKGCWEGEFLVAKRRRRSAHNHQTPQEGAPESGAPAEEEAKEEEEEEEEEGEGEEEGKGLSVVEMVAFLEQRAGDQLVDAKPPVSLRSSTTITLSKPPPEPSPREAREGPDDGEEESVRVSDMVAKLESECLKQRGVREGAGGGGELSRNNSLRRIVGRVLLAGADACSASAQPPTPPRPLSPSPAAAQVRPPAAVAPPEKPAGPPGPDPDASPCRGAPPEGSGLDAGGPEGGEAGQLFGPDRDDPAAAGQREEPLPGMLFFPPPPVSEQQTHTHPHRPRPLTSPDTEPGLGLVTEPGRSETPPPAPVARPSDRDEEVEGGGDDDSGERCELAPFPLRRLVSHEFLEVRFKIQLLLEPQQYLALLPHHVLLQIFSLLPTRALAALACSCHYFRFVIESYDVRPTDSRWVCDPRYRDDPCKQCKRRYGRGDVSLCRWHHKPYCQAMPYGPGYWMCCHGTRRDAPGCNVGVHDNRWVPAFHSISMPIYKRARDAEEEAAG